MENLIGSKCRIQKTFTKEVNDYDYGTLVGIFQYSQVLDPSPLKGGHMGGVETYPVAVVQVDNTLVQTKLRNLELLEEATENYSEDVKKAYYDFSNSVISAIDKHKVNMSDELKEQIKNSEEIKKVYDEIAENASSLMETEIYGTIMNTHNHFAQTLKEFIDSARKYDEEVVMKTFGDLRDRLNVAASKKKPIHLPVIPSSLTLSRDGQVDNEETTFLHKGILYEGPKRQIDLLKNRINNRHHETSVISVPYGIRTKRIGVSEEVKAVQMQMELEGLTDCMKDISTLGSTISKNN